jgi:putative ABC transport system permease protein
MIAKLVLHSFRRDIRKKAVAIAAVALATCLATFLLNWSLNLGDKIQRDLRAYGSNIVILSHGESLPISIQGATFRSASEERYLQSSELEKIDEIFWKNQIVGMTPVLFATVQVNQHNITLAGTEFGLKDPKMDLRKAAPYLLLDGDWPSTENSAVAGSRLAQRFGWKRGDTVNVQLSSAEDSFRITGIVHSGGVEEEQLIAPLQTVQKLTGHESEFKQLLVSAMVTPQNNLYEKYQRNPSALTPKEFERFSCTPYVTSVASDIAKVFTGGEARIIRQISQSEEKISQKVNWLMFLVTFAALIASSLTMASTTTAMIMERRKELALMKAIGSQNSFLLLYLFIEVAILGIIGSAAGFAIGGILSTGLSRSIFDSPMDLKWAILPIVACTGLLIIFCGSFLPIRRAMTLDPSQTLKDL